MESICACGHSKSSHIRGAAKFPMDDPYLSCGYLGCRCTQYSGTAIPENTKAPVPDGSKYDAGKARWDAVPFGPMEEVVKILTFGIGRYAKDNWQLVPDPKERYFAAAMRHLSAWRRGQKRDPDSGHLHLAHAATCILFLILFDEKEPDAAP